MTRIANLFSTWLRKSPIAREVGTFHPAPRVYLDREAAQTERAAYLFASSFRMSLAQIANEVTPIPAETTPTRSCLAVCC